MEQRKHWWNGTWGRLAREDVALRTNGVQWEIWVRRGGAESNDNRRTVYDTEAEAREVLDKLLANGQRWQRKPPKRRP